MDQVRRRLRRDHFVQHQPCQELSGGDPLEMRSFAEDWDMGCIILGELFFNIYVSFRETRFQGLGRLVLQCASRPAPCTGHTWGKGGVGMGGSG